MNRTLAARLVALSAAALIGCSPESPVDAQAGADAAPIQIVRGPEVLDPVARPESVVGWTPNGGGVDLEATDLTLRGVVVDTFDRPLSGVEVECRDSRAVSGDDGRFELAVTDALPRSSLLVDVAPTEAQPLTRIASTPVSVDDSDVEVVVVAAPAWNARGRVVEADGTPVPDARVFVALDRTTLRHLDRRLDALALASDGTNTREDGSFEWTLAPLVDDRFARLVARGPDGRRASIALSSAVSEGEKFLVLPPLAVEDEAETLVARGVVTGPLGHPVEGAFVGTTPTRGAVSDARGRFELSFPPGREPGPDTALFAAARDHGPVVLDDFGALCASARPAAPAPFELVLGGRRSITGHVLDAAGRPLSRWEVWVADTTATWDPQVDGPQLHGVEGVRGRVRTTSDGDGRFELLGLFDRPYTLVAYNPETMQAIEAVATPNEGMVQLVVPENGTVPTVTGVVVDRAGAPVEGVRVSLSTHVDADGGASMSRFEPARTDATGAFTLDRVPKERALLTVEGAGVLRWSTPVTELDLGGPVRLEVVRTHAVKFVVGDGSPPDLVVSARDRSDAPLPFVVESATYRSTVDPWPLIAGHNPTVTVSEDAHELVFWAQDASGERTFERIVPLVFEPDGVTTIEFDDF